MGHKHTSNQGKIAVNRHQTQSKTSANNQERAIEKKTRQESKEEIASQQPVAQFVIRSKYVQPDGIGWVGEDGHVYHDPSYAHHFATEDEAWGFIGLNYATLGGPESAWPEVAVDYTKEERLTILQDYDKKRLEYYGY